MVLLQIGSRVIIRKPNLPGTIVGKNKDDKNLWLVEYAKKKGEEKKSELFSRWHLRASKSGDPNFKESCCSGSNEVIVESETESSDSTKSKNDEDEDSVNFPLPDCDDSESESELSLDEKDDKKETFTRSKSIYKQCKDHSQKPIDNGKVPFGKRVRVVILKGKRPGIIMKAKGPKLWEVKYKDLGIIKLGLFKSKQMRRPRDKSEYFFMETEKGDHVEDSNDDSEDNDSEDDDSEDNDTDDDSDDDSDNDPNDEEEDIPPRAYQNQVDAEDSNEGQAAFDEYEMRFAVSLEPKDERYDRKVKEYQVKLKALLDEGFSIIKRKTMKSMGPNTRIIERRKGGRKGVIVGGAKGVWEIKFDDGTIEDNIRSQRLKRANKDGVSHGPSYIWRLVEESHPEQGKEIIEYTNIGLAGFDFERKFSEESIKSKKKDYNFPFLELLQTLWPGEWRQQLERLNSFVEHNYNKNRASKRRMSSISQNEWWRFIGILIGASPLGKGGNRNLFDHHEHESYSYVDPINLGTQKNGRGYMSLDRFIKIRSIFPRAFALADKQDSDPWFMILDLLEGFNRNRKTKFAASATKTDDESMSAFTPQTTPTGGLPTISFIKRKPEPLGTEFKTVCCAYTGVMLFVELQRGKAVMPSEKYSEIFGCTAACTLRLAEGTQHCGTNVSERREAAEVFKRELVLADAWFGSVKAAEQLKMLHIDDDGNPAGHEMIAAVKSNHSRFPKKEIEQLMEEFPSGSHLVFECCSPMTGVPLVAIGYKYNARKVLCFIATKNAGSTRPGKPYIARFPDEFGNVSNRAVPRPSIITQYFENSDKVDAHNHVRQYQLALEKRWITHCGWFRISTTFIGITLSDAWKCVKFQSKNSVLRKLTIKQFADRVAWDCANNPHSDDKDSTTGNSFIQVNATASDNLIGDDDCGIAAAPQELSLLSQLLDQAQISCIPISELASLAQSSISPLSSSQGSRSSLSSHEATLNDKKTSDGRTARRRCRICHKQTPWMCAHPVCRAQSDGKILFGSFYCNSTKKDGSPKCIDVHQAQVEEFMNK